MNTECNQEFTRIGNCGATVPACFRYQKPLCPAVAVIPAITVDTTEGVTSLANSLVHVTSNNTTYYIDDKHRPMLVWAGPAEIDAYDIEDNPNGLRSQFCLTTINGKDATVYFDKQGVAKIISKED